MKNKSFLIISLIMIAAMLLTACEGETVEVTRVVKETVVEKRDRGRDGQNSASRPSSRRSSKKRPSSSKAPPRSEKSK